MYIYTYTYIYNIFIYIYIYIVNKINQTKTRSDLKRNEGGNPIYNSFQNNKILLKGS